MSCERSAGTTARPGGSAGRCEWPGSPSTDGPAASLRVRSNCTLFCRLAPAIAGRRDRASAFSADGGPTARPLSRDVARWPVRHLLHCGGCDRNARACVNRSDGHDTRSVSAGLHRSRVDQDLRLQWQAARSEHGVSGRKICCDDSASCSRGGMQRSCRRRRQTFSDPTLVKSSEVV